LAKTHGVELEGLRMPAMERMLKHMAWANQKVYAAVAELPDEALDAYLVNPEWPARVIVQHIVDGADWYNVCLNGERFMRVSTPATSADVQALAAQLALLDAKILEAAKQPEGRVHYEHGEDKVTNLRTTLIAQAAHHATEHRAQLMDALEFRGYAPIKLDSIDLWWFEGEQG
jgi:uncharacterized damage-inducible protein DinB